MRKITLLALFAYAGLSLHAAANTWTATISDSKGGAMHPTGEHNGKVLTARQCTLACIKGGAKYVAVVDGKVYDIANQDFKGLEQQAGRTVTLTGTRSGDTITVTEVKPQS